VLLFVTAAQTTRSASTCLLCPSALYQGHRPMGYTRVLWRLRRVDENLARCSSEPGILEDPDVTVPTCGS
jgi:hypothetical protein